MIPLKDKDGKIIGEVLEVDSWDNETLPQYKILTIDSMTAFALMMIEEEVKGKKDESRKLRKR